MSFASPALLWGLLALLPLIAVYFLRVRPRRRATPAYFLWQAVLGKKRNTALFQRLRHLLGLLLVALALVAVVLALADPRPADAEEQELILVIDRSASMAADDGGGSRLDSARAVASDLIRALAGRHRAAVASLDQELHIDAHLTDHPRQLLDAIAAIEGSDLPRRLDAVQELTDTAPETETETETEDEVADSRAAADVRQADGAASPAGQRRIVLITDGSDLATEDLPPGIAVHLVGQPVANQGIVACDLQYLPGARRRLGAFVRLAGNRAWSTERDLLFEHQQDDGHWRPLKILPLRPDPVGLRPGITTIIDDGPPGRWRIRLAEDAGDALSNDDSAWCQVREPEPIPVAIAGDSPFFYQRCIEAFASAGQIVQPVASEQAQVVVGEGSDPQAPRVVVFAPTGESPLWRQLGDELSQVLPRQLVDDHPLLRHCNAEAMPFTGARRLQAPAGARVLVANHDDTPLLYLCRQGQRRAVVINSDPTSAELFFRTAFPILVHNACRHLVDRGQEAPATVATRDGVPLPPAQRNLHGPAGPVAGRAGWSGPLPQIGYYHAGDQVIGASLLDAGCTLLDRGEVDAAPPTIASGMPWSDILLLVALIVLVCESLLYARRKVG